MSGEFRTPDDQVNHPRRYTKGKVECIDAIDSAVVGKPPDEAVCVANVFKYLWRYEEKEPVRSLESARWYLDRLIGKVKSGVVGRELASDLTTVDGGPESILTTIGRGDGL